MSECEYKHLYGTKWISLWNGNYVFPTTCMRYLPLFVNVNINTFIAPNEFPCEIVTIYAFPTTALYNAIFAPFFCRWFLWKYLRSLILIGGFVLLRSLTPTKIHAGKIKFMQRFLGWIIYLPLPVFKMYCGAPWLQNVLNIMMHVRWYFHAVNLFFKKVWTKLKKIKYLRLK